MAIVQNLQDCFGMASIAMAVILAEGLSDVKHQMTSLRRAGQTGPGLAEQLYAMTR
ncbi:MAG: hypothetical protein ACJATP_002758 [Candidatus Azotimanducaceae bacterium]|jgi:hypothetical protein